MATKEPMAPDENVEAQIAALLDRGSESGCLELSEVSELIQAVQLSNGDVDELYEVLQKIGVPAPRQSRQPERLLVHRCSRDRINGSCARIAHRSDDDVVCGAPSVGAEHAGREN